MQGYQIREQVVARNALAGFDGKGHGGVGFDRADAVDARDGGDDDNVVALEYRAGCRVAHAVDLFVDRGFFFDVGVGARDVGLGLVVVVVGDEILDGVFGEEAFHLAVELGGQRFVGREDERRALCCFDDLGHREGLARAGDAEQDLVTVIVANACDEFLNRRRLVAFRRHVRDDFERLAAFGLFRTRGLVRHEHRGGGFGKAGGLGFGRHGGGYRGREDCGRYPHSCRPKKTRQLMCPRHIWLICLRRFGGKAMSQGERLISGVHADGGGTLDIVSIMFYLIVFRNYLYFNFDQHPPCAFHGT